MGLKERSELLRTVELWEETGEDVQGLFVMAFEPFGQKERAAVTVRSGMGTKGLAGRILPSKALPVTPNLEGSCLALSRSEMAVPLCFFFDGAGSFQLSQ